MANVIELTIREVISIKIGQILQCSNGEMALTTLKAQLTYKNPKFIQNEKWGYSNFKTPKFLYTYHLIGNRIDIFRGALQKVLDHLSKFDIQCKIIDRTLVGEPVDFDQSKTIVRADQDEFITGMLQHTNGLGIAYTSFGKSVTCLELIKRLAQPAIVMMHTTFLQEQWLKEATDTKLFNLDERDIGGVGGLFKKRRFGKLNLCLYHSLSKENHLNFFKEKCGVLIVDEIQKGPIEAIQKVINKTPARYIFGVSAGERRKDGMEFLTYDAVGPVRIKMEENESDSKILAKIKFVKTGYYDPEYDDDPSDYTGMITRASMSRDRNILICKRALRAVRKDELVLILVERKAQAGIIAKMLGKACKVDMLLGPVNKKTIEYINKPLYKKMHELISYGHWEEFAALYDKYKDQIDKDIINAIKRKKYLAALALIDKKLKQISVSPAVRKLLLDYDNDTAYERIEKLASKKKVDVIIGTQKAEVGLSIRTIDRAIVTTPIGNNEERFNQVKGRAERKYKQKEIDYFGGEKKRPIIEVLVDDLNSSLNAKDKIRKLYPKACIKTKRRKR